MSKRSWLPAILISSLIASAPVAGREGPPNSLLRRRRAAVKLGDPVSEAQFAWLLFVYALQPANGTLLFETWTEQCQLNPAMLGCPPSPATRRRQARNLHGSALLQALRRKEIRAAAASSNGIECNSMQTTSSTAIRR